MKTSLKPIYILKNSYIELLSYSNGNILFVSAGNSISRLILAKRIEFKIQKNTSDYPGYICLVPLLCENLFSFFQVQKNMHIKSYKSELSGLISTFRNVNISAHIGFKRTLYISGVGFKFGTESILNSTYTNLVIDAGFSHVLKKKINVRFALRFSRKFKKIEIKNNNLQLLTQFLSRVRQLRTPDVYKRKGIRYKRDYTRVKEGKKKKSF